MPMTLLFDHGSCIPARKMKHKSANYLWIPKVDGSPHMLQTHLFVSQVVAMFRVTLVSAQCGIIAKSVDKLFYKSFPRKKNGTGTQGEPASIETDCRWMEILQNDFDRTIRITHTEGYVRRDMAHANI